jgi:hypothetical protein
MTAINAMVMAIHTGIGASPGFVWKRLRDKNGRWNTARNHLAWLLVPVPAA